MEVNSEHQGLVGHVNEIEIGPICVASRHTAGTRRRPAGGSPL